MLVIDVDCGTWNPTATKRSQRFRTLVTAPPVPPTCFPRCTRPEEFQMSCVFETTQLLSAMNAPCFFQKNRFPKKYGLPPVILHFLWFFPKKYDPVKKVPIPMTRLGHPARSKKASCKTGKKRPPRRRRRNGLVQGKICRKTPLLIPYIPIWHAKIDGFRFRFALKTIEISDPDRWLNVLYSL